VYGFPGILHERVEQLERSLRIIESRMTKLELRMELVMKRLAEGDGE
jgi:hypothetical protein